MSVVLVQSEYEMRFLAMAGHVQEMDGFGPGLLVLVTMAPGIAPGRRLCLTKRVGTRGNVHTYGDLANSSYIIFGGASTQSNYFTTCAVLLFTPATDGCIINPLPLRKHQWRERWTRAKPADLAWSLWGWGLGITRVVALVSVWQDPKILACFACIVDAAASSSPPCFARTHGGDIEIPHTSSIPSSSPAEPLLGGTCTVYLAMLRNNRRTTATPFVEPHRNPFSKGATNPAPTLQ